MLYATDILLEGFLKPYHLRATPDMRSMSIGESSLGVTGIQF